VRSRTPFCRQRYPGNTQCGDAAGREDDPPSPARGPEPGCGEDMTHAEATECRRHQPTIRSTMSGESTDRVSNGVVSAWLAFRGERPTAGENHRRQTGGRDRPPGDLLHHRRLRLQAIGKAPRSATLRPGPRLRREREWIAFGNARLVCWQCSSGLLVSCISRRHEPSSH
jgi:hypothetical protein